MRVVLGLMLQRSLRRSLLLGVSLGLFLILVGVSYASVDGNQIRSLLESLPPAIRAFLQGSDLATPAGYLGLGFVHPIALAILSATAIGAGAASARDVESGVAELMLSRPLKRTHWLGAQLIAMAIMVGLVTAMGVVGAGIAVLTVTDLGAVSLGALLVTGFMAMLLFIGVGAVTALAASFSRTAARAVAWGATFALVSYTLDYLAQIWGLVQPLEPLSVLHWYRPAEVLGGGSASPSAVLVLGGVAVLAATLALIVTSRREVAR